MRLRIALLISLTVACALVLSIQAAPPQWWSDYGVTATEENGQPAADDFAVLNQGQLKQMALSAYWMLENSLPGGAGPDLHTHLSNFYDFDEEVPKVSEGLTDDFAAVNQGQLKAMAAPFYDRLIAVGYVTYSGTAPADSSTVDQ